jgi:hypothetical protein
MITDEPLLVTLVKLVDRLPQPSEELAEKKRGRGRPNVYSNRLFLKALVIMLIKHLSRVYELLCVLEQPTAEMRALRLLLTEDGRYPSRRTFERHLKAMPETLPARIACLGRELVELIEPWARCGRAALDSTLLRAQGGVWQKKDREKGEVPHTSIDTEAHWGKSGWHVHIACTVAGVWIPLAARLTPANVADNQVAPQLLKVLPDEARYVLGDLHYNAPDVRELCEDAGRILVTPEYGAYPHTDDGVEVRRVFHELRSRTIENFNEQFKAIFEGHAQVPTKGLLNTTRFALGAVFVYQLALLYRHEHGQDLRVGIKAFLKAA